MRLLLNFQPIVLIMINKVEWPRLRSLVVRRNPGIQSFRWFPCGSAFITGRSDSVVLRLWSIGSFKIWLLLEIILKVDQEVRLSSCCLASSSLRIRRSYLCSVAFMVATISLHHARPPCFKDHCTYSFLPFCHFPYLVCDRRKACRALWDSPPLLDQEGAACGNEEEAGELARAKEAQMHSGNKESSLIVRFTLLTQNDAAILMYSSDESEN